MQFAALQQTAALARALNKSGAVNTDLEEMRKYYGGPAFGHISQEYIFSSNVFPLGIILQLFGSEGCCKSTIALSLLNQLFLDIGGEGHVIDTENKVSIPLFESVVNPVAVADKRFGMHRASTLEQAQGVMTALATGVNQATFGKKHDPNPHLLGLIVDSFRVSSQTTQENVKADGHASKQYALEANLWRQYLSTFTGLLTYAPMALIVVNHMVEKESATGYGKIKDVGGGTALKFYETYRILVGKVKAKNTNTEVYTDVSLKTYKNSNGVVGLSVQPRVIYKMPDLEPGRAKVDWDIADARLLSGPDIPRAELKKEGICDVKESSKAGLYSDSIMGLNCVPFSEIWNKIISEPERLAQLRHILGIKTYKDIDALWEAGWFFDAKTVAEED